MTRLNKLGSALLVLAAWVLMLVAATANAHESRPLNIEIDEGAKGLVTLRWRTPSSIPEFNVPEVSLTGCQAASPIGTTRSNAGPISQRRYTCENLDGQSVVIAYPLMNPSVSSLVRLYRANGETHSVIGSPEETTMALPEAATTGKVAKEYFVLGMEHFLGGYDHVLFVACLVLIARTMRRILITITGFTLAHSLTLVLAALEVVRIPVPPVEVVIALSIVFLATELTSQRRDTLTWRHPIAVSSSFGLLHGLGFASVLSELGLPQTEVPTALLFFNVGIEMGQIIFVALGLVAFQMVRKLRLHKFSGQLSAEQAMTYMERPTGYLVGCLAAVWVVERIHGFF